MKCRSFTLANCRRLVGDPIDVVSGANTDVVRDFDLPGALPLDWRRHYDSSRNTQRLALGWGHTHSYDLVLKFDNDGFRYIKPVGETIGFPPLHRDGDEIARDGCLLRRVGSLVYHLHESKRPIAEFQFANFKSPAPVKRLRLGEASITFGYDNQGRLLSITDSVGRRLRVAFGVDGLLQAVSLLDEELKPRHHLIVYSYDQSGNLLQGTDVYGNTFRFEYDEDHRMARRTDRLGYSFLFSYDRHGRCIHSRGADGLHEVRLEYKPEEQTTLVTRADGGEWSYLYDSNGFIHRIVDPYGGIQAFIPDATGRLVQEIDPNGNSSDIICGATGAPEGRISSLERFSPLPDEPEPVDRWAYYVPTNPMEWEQGGRVPSAGIERPALDAAVLDRLPVELRNLVQCHPVGEHGRDAEPGEGGDPRRIYDPFGRWIGERIDGSRRRFVRDANGNIRAYTDADGSQLRQEHSGWNQLTRSVNALGHAVTYSYTRTECVSAITDVGGATTEYRYDLKDRLIEIKRHGVIREKYRYDNADNLVAKLDGNGNTLVSYEIGPGNLIAARQLESGETHTFTYDEHGRIVTASTDGSATTFEYDGWGNRTEDKRDGKGVSHRYDTMGRLVETTFFDRFRLKYERRPHGVVRITDPTGATQSIQNFGGGIYLRTLSNGSSELSQYAYEGRCLLKSKGAADGSNRPWTRQYSYSPEGDLLSIEDSRDGRSEYSYDSAHRLVGMRAPAGRDGQFKYDEAGNLIEQPGLQDTSLLEGNRLATANGDRFEYNARNHVSRRSSSSGTTLYHYDSRDMLTRCELRDCTVDMRYDALGRRVAKTCGQAREEFYWDGERLAVEVRSDGRLRIYVYTNPLAVVPFLFIEYDSLDAEPTSGKQFFIFTNQIGAPLLVEDAAGSTVWRATIDPYGRTTVASGSRISLNLRFPGHYFDHETGLHYNRFRYYSPELGRYIQSDPSGLMGGVNLYAYTSSPLSHVDVRGLACPACEAGPKKTKEEGLEHEDLPKPSELEPVSRPSKSKPFDDLPSLKGKSSAEVRRILKDAGFTQTQHERTLTVDDSDDNGNPIGTRTVTDSQGGSEIWMRRDQDDNYEAVRMDQHGHARPDWAEKGKPFHGQSEHLHKEALPNDQERRDNATNPRTKERSLPPGTDSGGAADSYNKKWTPGVNDTYDDQGQQTDPGDVEQNHVKLEKLDE